MLRALHLLSAIAATSRAVSSASDATLRSCPGRLLSGLDFDAPCGDQPCACGDGYVLEPIRAEECPQDGACPQGLTAECMPPSCTNACPGTLCEAINGECGLPNSGRCYLFRGTGLWRKTFEQVPTVNRTVAILGSSDTRRTGRKYLSFDNNLNVNLAYHLDNVSHRTLWNFIRNTTVFWYLIKSAAPFRDGPRFLTALRDGTNVVLDRLYSGDDASLQRWFVPVGLQTPPACCAPDQVSNFSSICYVFDWTDIRIFDADNTISPSSNGQRRALLSTNGFNVDNSFRDDRSGNQRWVVTTA